MMGWVLSGPSSSESRHEAASDRRDYAVVLISRRKWLHLSRYFSPLSVITGLSMASFANAAWELETSSSRAKGPFLKTRLKVLLGA